MDQEHVVHGREENSVGSHGLPNPAQVVADLGVDPGLPLTAQPVLQETMPWIYPSQMMGSPQSLWSERRDHYHILMLMGEK